MERQELQVGHLAHDFAEKVSRRWRWLRPPSVLVLLTALLTLGSGVVNIASVIGPALPGRLDLVRHIFPLEFAHLSRFVTLSAGFFLVIASLNIYRRKRRAYYLVAALALVSVLFHLTKGLDYEEATVSIVLLAVLAVSRHHFTVKSNVPSVRLGFLRLVIALAMVGAYGVAGFWYLEPHEFGINFHIGQAVHETLLFLAFFGDDSLVPHTHYARWFLHSLYFFSVLGLIYGFAAIFRPVRYRFLTLPHEREQAAGILQRYGRHSLDYFKAWPDKSYFFSDSGESFLAYRVGTGFAVVLGDPVGAENELPGVIEAFTRLCRDNDWGLAFHQTLPDFLPVYERLGFHKLKIGDDAIVDLQRFSLQGKDGKGFRYTVNRLEAEGLQTRRFDPPIPDEVLDQARAVSDDWMQIAGRRERGFTLGWFDSAYIRSTPLFAVVNEREEMQAFANLIPAYRPGESTIDLMRRRSLASPGVMDYLFIRLFLHLKERGFLTFNLGMAPMAGFRDGETATLEERSIHYFFQHMNFLFSFRGLRSYKAKFASVWEPRYVVYQNVLDLARHAIAIAVVSKM